MIGFAVVLLGVFASCHGAVVFECDFDEDFCGMEQLTNDNYDWSRGPRTPSGNTGPSADHTTGSGDFAFIEASGKNGGTFADLAVPAQTGSPVYCLRFYYNLFGQHIRSLDVYESASGQVVWTQTIASEPAGVDEWVAGEIDFTGSAGRLVFRAIKGGSNTNEPFSDIAIDDVSVEDIMCDGTAPTTTAAPTTPTTTTTSTSTTTMPTTPTTTTTTAPTTTTTATITTEPSTPEPTTPTTTSTTTMPPPSTTAGSTTQDESPDPTTSMPPSTSTAATTTMGPTTTVSPSTASSTMGTTTMVMDSSSMAAASSPVTTSSSTIITTSSAMSSSSSAEGMVTTMSTDMMGSSTVSVSTAVAGEVLFSCEFGSGDDCDMQQSSLDDLSWEPLRASGLSGIGPTQDASGDANGFVYVAQTRGETQDKVASVSLFSGGMSLMEGQYACVSLFYYMNGLRQGELRLATGTEEGVVSFSTIASGNRGMEWHSWQGSVWGPLHQVAIEAETGDEAVEHIVIDNIQVLNGLCPGETMPPSSTSTPEPRDSDEDDDDDDDDKLWGLKARYWIIILAASGALLLLLLITICCVVCKYNRSKNSRHDVSAHSGFDSIEKMEGSTNGKPVNGQGTPAGYINAYENGAYQENP